MKKLLEFKRHLRVKQNLSPILYNKLRSCKQVDLILKKQICLFLIFLKL